MPDDTSTSPTLNVDEETTTAGRGVPLTVLLVIITLAQVAGLAVGLLAWRSLASHPGLPLFGVALSVAGLVAATGMWLWGRWAVFLFAALTVIGVGADIWYGSPPVPALVRVALLLVLGFFVKQRWSQFR